MAIHRDLPDSELHLPIGTATASTGQVYIADGLGSGAWAFDAPENFVFINEAADFPSPVGDTIQLADNTVYMLGADVSIATKFAVGDNSVITSLAYGAASLTYTGTSIMFNGVDKTFSLFNTKISAPNGQVFDLDYPANTGVLTIDFCTFENISSLGFIDNVYAFGCYRNMFADVDQGFTFLGADTIKVVDFTNCLVTSTAASLVFVDLGTAVVDTFVHNYINYSAPAGAIGIDGAASSANIASGRIAAVYNCVFGGGMTATGTNIVKEDIRWNFRNNFGIGNSLSEAETYLTTSRTTPVAVTATFYDIGGADWAYDFASRFTVSTAGVLTYIGENDLDVAITGTATVSKVGGGADIVAMRIAKNGTSLAKSNTQTQNAYPTSVAVHALLTLSTNDTVSLQVANNTTTADIIVSVASLVVR